MKKLIYYCQNVTLLVVVSMALLLNVGSLRAQTMSIDNLSIEDIKQQANKEGNGMFQFILGYYYEHGKRVPQDLKEAKYWYKQSLTNGGPDMVKVYLALIYDKEKNYSEEYPLLLSFVENTKNEEGQKELYRDFLFRIGLFKYDGKGTPVDIPGAIEYLKKARDRGFVYSIQVLYGCYEKLGDIDKCFSTAKELYEKTGLPISLAKHYLFGEGCNQDLEKVYNLLSELANGKLAYQISGGGTVSLGKDTQTDAQLYVGIANYFDKNKVNHYEEGVNWLNKVIASPDADNKNKGLAKCLLQRCYRFGRGVRQDITKANELEGEAKRLLSEEDYNDFSKKFQSSY